MSQTNNTGAYIAGSILIVGLAYVVINRPSNDTPVKPDAPVVVVDAMSDLKSVVSAAPKDKSKRVGYLYLAMADVLSRMDQPVSSVTLRAWLEKADVYLIQGTDLAGSIPGFTDKRNAVLNEKLGLDVKDYSPEDLKKVAELCKEIASVCGAK